MAAASEASAGWEDAEGTDGKTPTRSEVISTPKKEKAHISLALTVWIRPFNSED